MAGPPDPPPQADIEAGLRQAGVPGAAVGAIHRGEPTWVATYGTVRAGGDPVVDDTVFQAASLSKPVTAMGILRLVDEGRLPLDEDVRSLVSWPIPTHATFTGSENAPITVRLLLQHRAGIVGRGTTPHKNNISFLAAPAGGGSHRVTNRAGAVVPTLEQSWKGSDGRPPVMLTTEPGSGYAYSGAGFLILQHLVEQVTGVSFADHFANEVFPALDAQQSTFALIPPAHWELASGHNAEGQPLTGERELTPWSSAGGLFSTARDLTLSLAMLLNGGRSTVAQFMSAETATAMVTQSLGTFVTGAGGTDHVFRHGGDNGGFRTLMLGHPPSGSGVIVLTNGRSNVDTKLREQLGSYTLQQLRSAS